MADLMKDETATEKLERMHARLEKSETFQIECLKNEVSEMIYRIMDGEGVSNAEMAARLNTSRAYITKVLQGTANFTLESLYKIAHALNCDLKFKMVPKEEAWQWQEYKRTAAAAGVGARINRDYIRLAHSVQAINEGTSDERLASAA